MVTKRVVFLCWFPSALLPISPRSWCLVPYFMMLRCVSQRVSGASFRQSVLQGQPSYHVPRTLFGRSANTSQIPTDQAASEQPQAGEGDSNAQLKAMEEKYTAELEKAEKSFKEVQVMIFFQFFLFCAICNRAFP